MAVTLHKWMRDNHLELERKMWPVGPSPIPFHMLNDDRLCHILRRLEREMLTHTQAYRDLAAIGHKRNLSWFDTHTITTFQLTEYSDVSNETLKTAVCINPMGIEVVTVLHHPGSDLADKLYLTWDQIEEIRNRVTEAQQPQPDSPPEPERPLDL